ncbi:uncharacterized protein H6S33_008106 [Morchella sextelata]|uniref:uncharacterized protein n=1 Tax=Morchella sextelata TaxID=1174677 RepID=UPI001D0535CC|nr:uncharacterized protein H6S33_008106 [Morchella sextelata]KAH0603102.1 hypothetical protein H6S33_008106 [Morchella sextelata]
MSRVSYPIANLVLQFMATEIRSGIKTKTLSKSRNRLTSLPNELLLEIAKNLDRTDLSRLLQVNHHASDVLTQIFYDDVVQEPAGYKPYLEITYKIFTHSVTTGMLAPMVNLLVRNVTLPPPIIKEAIRSGHMNILSTMLLHDEPAVRGTITEEYEINSGDEYPLTTAVITGRIEVFRFVLRFLNIGHRSILPATQEAISRNRIATVFRLMRLLSDEQLSLAFHYACNANSPGIARQLIAQLPTAKRPETATKGVSAAIRGGQPYVLRCLIALGADLHVSAGLDPDSGWREYAEETGNHLHWLTSQGVLEWRNRPDQLLGIYQVLLTSGLDINETNSYNDTILMTLARNGPRSIDRSDRPPYRQMVEVYVLFHRLLRLILSIPGVDVNVRDITGETAFGVAVRQREYQMQDLLIRHGADTSLCVRK